MGINTIIDKLAKNQWMMIAALVLACMILIPIVFFMIKWLFVPVLIGTVSVILASVLLKVWMDHRHEWIGHSK